MEPDLRFTTDYATAARIAAGRLGAQRAFVEGRLRVGGDLSLLIRHHKVLSTIDDALAGVRARTLPRRMQRPCPRCPSSRPTPNA